MKSKLWKNTLLLGATNIGLKLVGMIFASLFVSLVTPRGVALFSYAFVPFSLFVDLATFGLPLGVSKVISEVVEEKNEGVVKFLKRKTSTVMIIAGIILALFFYVCAPYYARAIMSMQNMENTIGDVTNALRITSLAILFIPMVSLLRGVLQGYKRILPTAISLIIEQFVRMGFVLTFAFCVISSNKEMISLAVYGAVFGNFIGLFAALIYLYIAGKKKEKTEEVKDKKRLRDIYKLGFVSVVFGITFSLFQVVDSLTFNNIMSRNSEMSPEKFYGIYSFEILRLLFIPLILANTLALTMLPFLSKYKNDKTSKAQVVLKILNVASFTLLFMGVVIMIFPKDLYYLFFKTDSIGVDFLFWGALFIVLYGMNAIVLSISQTSKALLYCLITTVVAWGLKIYFNFVFLNAFGYLGAMYANIVAIGCSLFMNIFLLFLHKEIKLLPFLRDNLAIVSCNFIGGFIIYAYYCFTKQYKSAFINGSYVVLVLIVLALQYLFLKKKLRLDS